MCVILSKPANSHETMQNSAAFITVDRTQFGEAQGQLPVTAQSRSIYCDVEGAVHGFQIVFLLVHFHRREHALAVKVQVAAGLPERGTADVGRVHDVVSTPVVDVLPIVFYKRAYAPPLGMPYNQTRADFFVDGVEAELPPQSPVVAALRFFQPAKWSSSSSWEWKAVP